MYLRLLENVDACEFHQQWGFVYIVERHLLSLQLFRLRLHSHSKHSDNLIVTFGNHALELLSWTSWLSILSYWPSSDHYRLCRVPFTALLSHYPRKIFDLLRLHNGYCGSSIRHNNYTSLYKLSLTATSLAAWVTQAQTMRQCFKLLLFGFSLCFWECARSEIITQKNCKSVRMSVVAKSNHFK